MSWTLYRIETHSTNEFAYFYTNPSYPGICKTLIQSNSKAIYRWLKLLGINNGYIDTALKLPYSSFGDVGSHDVYTWAPRASRPLPNTALRRGSTIGPAKATTGMGRSKKCDYMCGYNRLLNSKKYPKGARFRGLLHKVHYGRMQMAGAWGGDYAAAKAAREVHQMVEEERRRCARGLPPPP